MSDGKFWDGKSGPSARLARIVEGSQFRTGYSTETLPDGTQGSIMAKSYLGHTDVFRDGMDPSRRRGGGGGGKSALWKVSSWQAFNITKFNATSTQKMAFNAQGFGGPRKAFVGNTAFLGSTFVAQNYSVGIQGGPQSLQVTLLTYSGSVVEGATDTRSGTPGHSFRFDEIVFLPWEQVLEAYVLPLRNDSTKGARFALVARISATPVPVTRVWVASASPTKIVDGQSVPNTLDEVTPPLLTAGMARPYRSRDDRLSTQYRVLSSFFPFGPGKIAAIARNADNMKEVGRREVSYSIPFHVYNPTHRILYHLPHFESVSYVQMSQHMRLFQFGGWSLTGPDYSRYDAGAFATSTSTASWAVFLPSAATAELVVYDEISGWRTEELGGVSNDVFVPSGSNPIADPVPNTFRRKETYPVDINPDWPNFHWTWRRWAVGVSHVIAETHVPARADADAHSFFLHNYVWEYEFVYADPNNTGPSRRRAEYPHGSAVIVWAGNTAFACVPGMRDTSPAFTTYTPPSSGFDIIDAPVLRGTLAWEYPNFAPLMYRRINDGPFERISWPGDAFTPGEIRNSLDRSLTKHLIQYIDDDLIAQYPYDADVRPVRQAWYSAGEGCAVFFFTDNHWDIDALITAVATVDGGNTWHTRKFLNTKSMASFCLLGPGTEKEIRARIDKAKGEALPGSFGLDQERMYHIASYVFGEYIDGKIQLKRMSADLSLVEEWGPLVDLPGRAGLINIEGPVHPGFPDAYERTP